MSSRENTISFGADDPGTEILAQISIQLSLSIVYEGVIVWTAKQIAKETVEKAVIGKLSGTLVKSLSSKAQYKLGLESASKLASAAGRNTAKLQAKFLTNISRQTKLMGDVAKGFNEVKDAMKLGRNAVLVAQNNAEFADLVSKIEGKVDDAARSVKEAENAVKAAKNPEDAAKAAQKLSDTKNAYNKAKTLLDSQSKIKNVYSAGEALKNVNKLADVAQDSANATIKAAKASRAAVQAARAAAATIRAARTAATVIRNVALKMGMSCIGGPVMCAVGVVLFIFDMINLALDEIDPSGISIFITKDDINTIAQITQQAKAQSLIDEDTPPDQAYGWFDTEVEFDPTNFFFDPVPDPTTGEFIINEEYFKMFDFYRDEYMKSIGVTPQWRDYIETVEFPSTNSILVLSADQLILKELLSFDNESLPPPPPPTPPVAQPKSSDKTLIIIIIVVIFLFILMFMFIK